MITAEYKQPDPQVKVAGLRLFTSTVRCSGPDVFDLRLNSHSRLNLIQALIQTIKAGAHEALMLDPHGFVASCNSTNFFIVRGGAVWTSSGRYNFMGITRRHVIELCERNHIPVRQTDFTLAECYSADEAFVTGTFGGVTRVSVIDGRSIGRGDGRGPVTQRLAALYGELVATVAARGRRTRGHGATQPPGRPAGAGLLSLVAAHARGPRIEVWGQRAVSSSTRRTGCGARGATARSKN